MCREARACNQKQTADPSADRAVPARHTPETPEDGDFLLSLVSQPDTLRRGPAQLFPAVGRTRTHTHSDIFAGASAVVGRKKKRPFYLRVDKELQSLLQLIPKATFTMIVFVCFLGGGGGLPPNFLFFFLTSANMLSPVYVFYSHIFNICFILLSYF